MFLETSTFYTTSTLRFKPDSLKILLKFCKALILCFHLAFKLFNDLADRQAIHHLAGLVDNALYPFVTVDYIHIVALVFFC